MRASTTLSTLIVFMAAACSATPILPYDSPSYGPSSSTTPTYGYATPSYGSSEPCPTDYSQGYGNGYENGLLGNVGATAGDLLGNVGTTASNLLGNVGNTAGNLVHDVNSAVKGVPVVAPVVQAVDDVVNGNPANAVNDVAQAAPLTDIPAGNLLKVAPADLPVQNVPVLGSAL